MKISSSRISESASIKFAYSASRFLGSSKIRSLPHQRPRKTEDITGVDFTLLFFIVVVELHPEREESTRLEKGEGGGEEIGGRETSNEDFFSPRRKGKREEEEEEEEKERKGRKFPDDASK